MTEEHFYFKYQPRRWQKEVLDALKAHRFTVVVAHRRAGKTEVMVLRLLLAAMLMERTHPAPLYGYIAPFLKQAKKAAWSRLKFYIRGLPDIRVSESDLTLTLWNNAVISVFGADNPDGLRGLGFDGIVLDEVAQMKPEVWPAVVRPALSDRNGWGAFIGTPKGQNAFSEIYDKALGQPGWFTGLYPADKTGVLPEEELADMRPDMGENFYRQELLCDFTADNIDSFIDFMSFHEASHREPLAYNPAPVTFGLDVARFGDDRTALVRRRGLVLEDLIVWRGQDLMRTATEMAEQINLHQPRAVFVDVVGLGAGVVDRLRQLGYKIIAVNSGAKASNPDKFVNLKAEMWSRMRDWLAEGAVVSDRPELRKDVLAPRYDFDHSGRLKIESKDDLKARGLLSTDCADALALTFAQPVALFQRGPREQKFYERD